MQVTPQDIPGSAKHKEHIGNLRDVAKYLRAQSSSDHDRYYARIAGQQATAVQWAVAALEMIFAEEKPTTVTPYCKCGHGKFMHLDEGFDDDRGTECVATVRPYYYGNDDRFTRCYCKKFHETP